MINIKNHLKTILLLSLFTSCPLFKPQITKAVVSDDLPPRNQPTQAREEDDSTNTKENSEKLKIQIQQKREAVKSRVEEKKETVKQQREQLKQRLVAKHTVRIGQRFRFYEQRLNRIIEKIEQKITQLESDGHDLEAARQELGTAKSSLEQAQATADQAINKLTTIENLAEEKRINSYEEAQQITLEARQLFQEVLTSLKQVVKLTKEEVTNH